MEDGRWQMADGKRPQFNNEGTKELSGGQNRKQKAEGKNGSTARRGAGEKAASSRRSPRKARLAGTLAPPGKGK